MRKRSEIGAAGPPTSTRVDADVQCGACHYFFTPDADTPRRVDGTPECPKCGMPVQVDPGEAPVKARPRTVAGPKDPHRKYCGECASEWPVVDGNFAINCGHTKAERVAHPDEAKANKPPAGLQGRSENVPKPPPPAAEEVVAGISEE